MPQLSLYMDTETLSKIETAAKISNTSISKWVSDRLRESLSTNWPDNYRSLFGSIRDETFDIKEIGNFSVDVKRVEL